jgi:hypothetical protein
MLLISADGTARQTRTEELLPIDQGYPGRRAIPTGWNLEARLVAYVCVVVPIDHDHDEPTATSPTKRRWSGQFVITPQPYLPPSGSATTWSLGTTSSTFKVCRYTGNYVNDAKLSNSEHPLYYRHVTGTLDNQNYLVIQGHRDCPYDGPTNTASGDYYNTNTTLHQTTESGPLPRGGLRSGTNFVTPAPAGAPASVNGGIGPAFVEPLLNADATVELPML